jgi:uncharacterized coiled-coil protein SlyX
MKYATTYVLLESTKTAYEQEIAHQRKSIKASEEVITRLEIEVKKQQDCMDYLTLQDKKIEEKGAKL